MEINIKKNKEDKVLEFVKEAISLFDPDSSTLTGKEKIHKFDQYVYALSNLIGIQGIKNFKDTQSIIWSAIRKSKNYSPLTLNVFEKLLKEARREALEKQKEKYYFVFPLKIKYNSIKKRHFTLLGTKIKVCSNDYIKRNFSYEVIKEEAEGYLKPSLTYFIIEEYAIDESRAGDSASDKLELLRSIINFTDQYMKVHYHFGESKLLSLIYPPKAFFGFDSDRTFCNTWVSDITYDSREIDFNSEPLKSRKVIERSEKLIKKINSVNKGGLRDLIIEAFYLHNNALDYYDKKWLSFLSLWQIFEFVTLSSKYNLKQDEVCKRMISLLKEKDPYEDIINVFKKKRNKFVHKAELRDFTWNDINMMIGIAQSAIIFLIYSAANLKDIEGLNFFYNNIHTLEKEFKTKTGVLRYIEKNKTKNRKRLFLDR